jgi:hypothetical protein
LTRNNYSTPGSLKFDKLLTLLRNGNNLEVDYAAKLVAALVVNAKNQSARDEAYDLIETNLGHIDSSTLFAKVNGYIENPPADNFASLLPEGILYFLY